MSDYIPRKYAIVAIENAIMRREPKEGESELIKAYNAGFKTAMEQAKIELMQIKSKTDWIPVEMRLPPKTGIYLASDMSHVFLVEYDSNLESNKTGLKEDRTWWSIDFNQYVTGILAWMPMPDAYRRKEVKKK